jgi:hypothetical protein
VLEELSSQLVHIAPSQCQRTGVVATRFGSLHPIQLGNSVVRCWPREHLRANASIMHHKLGTVTDYSSRTTIPYPIVAMLGLRLAAWLTKKRATAALRKAAVPNPKRLTNICYRDIKLELDLE